MSETLPVPPEIVAKAEAALARRARCYADGRPTVAETVLAAVYGDIVAEKDAEIARLRVERDAAQAEAYRLMLENAGQRGELDACEDAIEICEADRDRAVAEARREARVEALQEVEALLWRQMQAAGKEGQHEAHSALRATRHRIVADLADAPRKALSATESDQDGGSRVSGSDGVQKRSEPLGAVKVQPWATPMSDETVDLYWPKRDGEARP